MPAVLCDLDGVVWLSREPIPGAVEAVRRLQRAGRRVLFITNNSVATLAEHTAALGSIGIDAEGDVVSSAMAAALLVEPGERVYVVGGAGVREAVANRGAEVCDAGPVDAVVVGLDRQFGYERLTVAARAVHEGARLIGTNADATYPTPDGEIPGGGAILAAVATASGADPVIAGKPHEPMARLVRQLLGGDASTVADAVMVGDRPETDGLFARRLGCRFALVYTGVTPPGASVEPAPDLTGADLGTIVSQLGA